MTAEKRYSHPRIKQVFNTEKGLSALLSMKYGVLRPEDPVPFHDPMIRENRKTEIINELKHFIKSRDVDKIIYYRGPGDSQHLKLVKAIAQGKDIKLETRD